jgi:hypothetical protein
MPPWEANLDPKRACEASMTLALAAWALPWGVDWDPRFLINGSLFAGALLVGAVVIALFQRWRRREDKRLSPDAQLAQFQSLYEAGMLDREEFERLSGVLGGKARQAAPDRPPARPGDATSAPSDESIQPAPGAGPPPSGPDTGIQPG